MNARTTQQFVSIAAAIFIMSGLATIGTAQVNDPNALWDSSDLFAATWESATHSVTAYNPVERPDLDPLTREHAITVTGNVYILDANDLIGVATTHTSALQAFDQDANAVRFDPNAPERSPGRTWVLGEEPKPFSVELHLDRDQATPTSLSQLDFTVDTLYGQPFTIVDLPLEVTEDWILLAPRYRVRVDEVNVANNGCSIVISEEITDVQSRGSRSFDPNDGPWEEIPWYRDNVREFTNLDLITDVGVVDTEGNPFSGSRSYSASLHLSNGVMTGTRHFTLRDCTDIENWRIRYAIAMDLYEMPIPLTLTEISIPGP